MLTAIGVIFCSVDKVKFYILYRDYKALPGYKLIKVLNEIPCNGVMLLFVVLFSQC